MIRGRYDHTRCRQPGTAVIRTCHFMAPSPLDKLFPVKVLPCLSLETKKTSERGTAFYRNACTKGGILNCGTHRDVPKETEP